MIIIDTFQGVLGWCFNISQGKMTIIDAFRAF